MGLHSTRRLRLPALIWWTGPRGVPLELPLRLACRMLLQAPAGQVAGSS